MFWTEGWKVAVAPAKLSKDQKRTAGTVQQLPQGSTHSADEKTDREPKADTGKQLGESKVLSWVPLQSPWSQQEAGDSRAWDCRCPHLAVTRTAQ